MAILWMIYAGDFISFPWKRNYWEPLRNFFFFTTAAQALDASIEGY